MRKAIILLVAALLVASVSVAAPTYRLYDLDVFTGARTSGTNTLTNVVGYVEEIQVLVTDGVSTGSVWVALVPGDSTVAPYNIATNVVADEKLFRPVVDSTDTKGAALTSDPPRRLFILGEKLRYIVHGSPTNKTWRARVKTVDQ